MTGSVDVPQRAAKPNKFQRLYSRRLKAAEREIDGSANIADLMQGGLESFSGSSQVWAAVRRSKVVQLLRELGDQDDAQCFKVVTIWLLEKLGIRIPWRTFTRFKMEPGAPVKVTTQKIRDLWDRDGRPRITSALCAKYAKIVHSAEYQKTKPGTKRHKNLIDKIRTPLIKYQRSQSATNSPSRIQ
jgi:hypothetical protein